MSEFQTRGPLVEVAKFKISRRNRATELGHFFIMNYYPEILESELGLCLTIFLIGPLCVKQTERKI